MSHILIILISFLLISPFLTSCEKYVGEYKDGKRNGQGMVKELSLGLMGKIM